jgi:hypothetical protein
MNDSDTLGFYIELQLFCATTEATTEAILQFPLTLSSHQCRIIHALAIKANLDYLYYDIDQKRSIIVFHRSVSRL